MQLLSFATSLLMLAAAGLPTASRAQSDPRTPEAISMQAALERVCLPLIEGGDATKVADQNGLRDDGDGDLRLGGPGEVLIAPPTKANPTVCSFTVTYPVDRPQPLVDLLSNWARSKGLAPQRDQEASKGPALARTTSSWAGPTPKGYMALAISQEKGLAGEPVAGELDRARVLVSLAEG